MKNITLNLLYFGVSEMQKESRTLYVVKSENIPRLLNFYHGMILAYL